MSSSGRDQEEARGTPYVLLLACWLLTPVVGGHGAAVVGLAVFFDVAAALALATSLLAYLVSWPSKDRRAEVIALVPLALYAAYLLSSSDAPQFLLPFWVLATHTAYVRLRSKGSPETF